MKKLSVIIPIYNAEKYLHRCIKSILNQTYTNIEIILVNDGSKDNSAKICEEYAKKNKNIIYVSKQNEGPGPARNKGIEIATGDFIGFVDSDDFIYKEMYFEMLREAVKNDADVVQCGYFKADEMGNILNEKSFTDKVLYIEGGYNCLFEYVKEEKINNFLCNKIYKRELFIDIKIPPLFAAEDQCALTNIFFKCNSISILSSSYYYYIMSPESLCRTDFNIRKLDNIIGGKTMYEFYKEKYEKFACFSSLKICSYIAQYFSDVKKSNIEDKEIILKEMLSDFKFHYEISRNSQALEYASKNRKALVNLFRFSPKLSSYLLNIHKLG